MWFHCKLLKLADTPTSDVVEEALQHSEGPKTCGRGGVFPDFGHDPKR
jgi:hypothetical protein